jgi:mannose-6-phosphate isomerase-like protein (cupin superfamily)
MAQKIRRLVTGHDASGKAIALFDGDSPYARSRPGSGITSTLMWVTDETPTAMDHGNDLADREIGVTPPRNGSVFRVVEFPPESQQGELDNEEMLRQMGAQRGGEGPARHPGMHRTASIDYAIIMSGEIDMLMDDTEVHLKAGDVVVQQGTNHAWANRGDQPCQIAFVLISANPPWE